jgi:hypothetical protein
MSEDGSPTPHLPLVSLALAFSLPLPADPVGPKGGGNRVALAGPNEANRTSREAERAPAAFRSI